MISSWRLAAGSRPCVSLTRPNARVRITRPVSDRICSSRRSVAGSCAYSTFFRPLDGGSRPSKDPLGGLRSIMQISDEVAEALATNKPVVALETTIYTHGALGMDIHLEEIVRNNGGVPAICGVYRGVPTVGLRYDKEVLQMVREGAQKLSRRDLALIIGMASGGGPQLHGGTTISGTMILAHLAGIRVFGTGGLGGVHRGGENSMDISADLTELGRTRVAVISSGCKGFLDIPRTLEYLETQGAVVSTFRQGKEGPINFPAFWARDSGVRSPSVVDSPRQAAATILAQEQLGLDSGLLFANPVPEEHAIPSKEMDAIINRSVREATEEGHTGSTNTPRVLQKISEYTDGLAKKVNVKLVQSNVKVATEVAVELAEMLKTADRTEPSTSVPVRALKTSASLKPSSSVSSPQPAKPSPAKPKIDFKNRPKFFVAGSVALDLSCDYISPESHAGGSEPQVPKLSTSNPAEISHSVGGVGHNVALALRYLVERKTPSPRVSLISMIGNDVAGTAVLSSLQASGFDTSNIVRLDSKATNARTAQYVSVNDSAKNLVLAMADMAILSHNDEAAKKQGLFDLPRDEFPHRDPKKVYKRCIVVDGNWSSESIAQFFAGAESLGNFRSVFEPVSVAKATRIFPPRFSSSKVFPKGALADLTTPNVHELKAMFEAASSKEYFEGPEWFAVIDSLDIGAGGARDRFIGASSVALTDEGIPQQCLKLLPFFPTIAVTLGDQGVFLAELVEKTDPRLRDPDHAKYFVARRQPDSEMPLGGVYMRHYPAVEQVRDVVSVNGVGDTFLGAMVAGWGEGVPVHLMVNFAQRAAVLSLRSKEAVSPKLRALRPHLESLFSWKRDKSAKTDTVSSQSPSLDSQIEESMQNLESEQSTTDSPENTSAESGVEVEEQPNGPEVRLLPELPETDDLWGEKEGVPPIPEPKVNIEPETPLRPIINERLVADSEPEPWGDTTAVKPVFKGEKRFIPREPVEQQDAVVGEKKGEMEDEDWGTSFTELKDKDRP